jgi:hypothetical protein
LWRLGDPSKWWEPYRTDLLASWELHHLTQSYQDQRQASFRITVPWFNLPATGSKIVVLFHDWEERNHNGLDQLIQKLIIHWAARSYN